MSNCVRPRSGYVKHDDGSRTAVRFVPTGEPDTFLAVTVDGARVYLGQDDTLTADVLRPGQIITVLLRLR